MKPNRWSSDRPTIRSPYRSKGRGIRSADRSQNRSAFAQWQRALLGLVVGGGLVTGLAVGCGQQPTAQTSRPVPGDKTTAEQPRGEQPVATAPAPSFQSPTVVASAGDPPPLPVPNLIPPTSAPERGTTVSAGRTDPFAALAVTPTVTIKPASPSEATAAAPTAPAPAPAIATVPVPINNLPPLPSLQPANPNSTELPSIAIPGTVAPPRSLAESIEVSGVVEVGGQTSVIVQVPSERSSRYATVGEYLANGQVLVKRIEMGVEPVVILEENGVETTRYIGGGSSLAGLM